MAGLCQRNGWTKPPFRPSTVGASACCANTPSTAAACSPRPGNLDHSDLLGEVLRDYWRLFCYPMHDDALNWVRNNWVARPRWMPRVRALFGSERPSGESREPAELITARLQERRAALVALKAPWPQWADELREICLQAVAAKAVDGRKMQARYFEPWFEKISAWAADESLEQLDIGTGFTRLTPDGMAEAWKGEPPHHPGIDATSASRPMRCPPPTPPCCNTPPRGSANASKMKTPARRNGLRRHADPL